MNNDSGSVISTRRTDQSFTPKGLNKVERYKWRIVDKPGRYMQLPKTSLRIDPIYQRDAEKNEPKILAMAANWSWISLGVLVVVMRDSGYFVVDGQHRLLAALRRSDIDRLPCLIFESEGIEHEARAFLKTNSLRKPINSADKYKAGIVAGDEIALLVQRTMDKYQIRYASHDKMHRAMRCIAWATRQARDNTEVFDAAMAFASELCAESYISERVIAGLAYFHKKGLSLHDKRLRDRLLKIGHDRLLNEANRASGFYAKGGAAVWARGMLEYVNKGLQIKFEYRGEAE